MFDTTAFLRDRFNDADGVMGLLNKHVPDAPRREAVLKWFQRGSVPNDWWPWLLIALRREDGDYPDLERYTTRAGDDGIFS